MNAALQHPWGLRPLIGEIPEAMRAGAWCCWRAEPRRGKPGKPGKVDKVPYHPQAGRRIRLSTKEPDTWGSFAEAVAACATDDFFDGPGRLVGPGEVWGDLDDCLEDGCLIRDDARRVLGTLKTYTEFSPSGTGLRLFGLGALPEGDITDHARGVELYGGDTPRFVTVTGHRFRDSPEAVRTLNPKALAVLSAAHGKSRSPTRVDLAMPELVTAEDLPDPEHLGLPLRVLGGLLNGFDGDDRSKAVQHATRCLYERGLTDSEVLSVLQESPGAWAVALDHRKNDPDKALAYLWKHCRDARHLAARSGFEERAEGPVTQPRGDALSRFLKRYVYITDGDCVGDLVKPPQHAISPIAAFKNTTANIRHELPSPTKADPDRVKLAAVHEAWLVHPNRKTAQGTIYRPGGPRAVKEDGLDWINTFAVPRFPESTGDTAVFEEHMDYLFPIAAERDWFISWIAFNLQRPETRCKVTPLHISLAHGTGRGWLVDLMRKLLGPWNCTQTKMRTLCGEGSAGGFQDYLNQSLFCAIEEVREGHKRFTVNDKIRDVLERPWMEVNLKYGGLKTQAVYTNFFFMSNHPDALVIGQEDRRINVFSGPRKVRDRRYYTRLHAWLDGDGVAALYHQLMARDVSDEAFDWQYSFDTPARQQMIEGNRTETETLFYELLADPPYPAMTFSQIIAALYGLSERGPMETQIDEGPLRKLLQHHARQAGRIKIGGKNGKAVRPWVLDPEQQLDSATIRQAVETCGI